VQYPSLQDIEAVAPPPSGQYVRNVLTVMATSLRFGLPDHLLVRSFWTGFGWTDTLPSPIVTQIVVLASGLAAVALLAYLSVTRDGRRLAVALLFLGGLVATLAAYALSVHWTKVNLHGRYLIGWYLCSLAAAWCVVALVPTSRRGWRVSRTAVLLTACAALHAYCLRFILCRYF